MIYALFFWCLVAFGIAWGVGHSRLTLGIREWLGARDHHMVIAFPLTLIECVGCFGFWTGVIGYYVGQKWLVPADLPLGALAFGFFTATSNLIIGRIVGLLES